jgi:hypothetical protein
MKKLFLLSLGTSMVLALSLVAPGNARAEGGNWKTQLASFGGSSNFDGGLGGDPPGHLDREERRLLRELLRDERDLTQDEDLESELHSGPLKYYRFDKELERLIEQQIDRLEGQIARIEKILSEIG